ncbi:hypothetical protein [Vibrio sp. M60_M70]|uniref:hypothetical protein n=1 Tax=Vibrio sp. M60_M70 TaxID=3035166 RepID=UPI00301BA175
MRLSQLALDRVNITAYSTIVVTDQKLLSTTGYINLDFAGLRTVLYQSGPTVIGYGEGVDEDRIQKAVVPHSKVRTLMSLISVQQRRYLSI